MYSNNGNGHIPPGGFDQHLQAMGGNPFDQPPTVQPTVQLPADTTPIESKSKPKTSLPKIKNKTARMAMFAGAGVLGLMVVGTLIGFAGSLLSNEPTIGEPKTFPVEQQAQSTEDSTEEITIPRDETTDPNTQSDAAYRSMWNDLNASFETLESQIDAAESDLSKSRAQRWRNWASAQCSNDPSCPSVFSLLLKKFASEYQQLRLDINGAVSRTDAESLSDNASLKMLTDSDSASDFRDRIATLKDIAAALKMEDGSNSIPRNYILLDSLESAIVSFYTSADQFDFARIDQSIQAYEDAARANQSEATVRPQIDPRTQTND